ncbi:MAG: ribonuclease HI [Alphaproteobacteria bacterium]|nr:ribonuclease HI [Alphaproteobacteria bacterium]
MAAARSEEPVDAFVDGACLGNPGPGGWGVLLRRGAKEQELSGGEALTTNNRMELMAAIRALEAIRAGSDVRVHTDSQYVKNGITTWIHSWKRNGWRTSGKDPVKNVDLWQALEKEVARHAVEWHWIRGHTGHAENERADRLAVEAARAIQRGAAL